MYKLLLTMIAAVSVTAHAYKGENDPTRPLLGTVGASTYEKAKSDLVLQSIIKAQREGTAKAIINGQLLKAGDNISIYEVVNITDKSVTLRSPDIERTLSLFSKAVVNNK